MLTHCATIPKGNVRSMRSPLKFRILVIFTLGSLIFSACTPQAPTIAPTRTLAPTSFPSVNIVSELGPQPSLPEFSISSLGITRFDHISIEEGLSESVVQCILQDSKGFLWFGTQDGLNRYDGYSFKTYRPDFEDTNSLSDRWITALHEDAAGNLWIGTRMGGLNKLDPKTGTILHILHNPDDLNSLVSNSIHALEIDSTGALWVGTDKGLDKVDPTSGVISHFVHNAGDSTSISSNAILSLHLDKLESLWIGTSDAGIDQFSLKTLKVTNYASIPGEENSLINNTVRAIVEDEMGRLWLGTAGGLVRFNPQKIIFERFTHSLEDANSLVNDTILSLDLDSIGDLWIGTAFGVDRYRIRTGQFIHYHHNPGDSESLSSDVIISLYEDQGGVIWIGTYGSGLNRFNRSNERFVNYQNDPNNSNSLSHNLVFPIYIDHARMVWVGTYGGGLNKLDPEKEVFFKYFHDPNNPGSLLSDFVTALYGTADDAIWVGTIQGLDRLDLNTGIFQHFKHDKSDTGSISEGEVTAIQQDQFGNLWVGTTSGLNLLDKTTGSFTHLNHNPDDPKTLSSDSVNSIYPSQDGQIWVATSYGLDRMDPTTRQVTSYLYDSANPNGISNNVINSVFQDEAHNFWVATGGGGLDKYDPVTDTFERYLIKNGLPSDVVYGMLEDTKGDIWLSTNYGISKFNPRTERFLNYTVSDGLQSNEFNARAYAMSPDGLMYFGGVNGLTAFNPEFINESTYVPPLALTSLTTEGKPITTNVAVEYLQEFTLHWPVNSFEFEFAVLGFAEPQKNQYAYMLENFDRDWYTNGTKRDGRYTNLQGGTYFLHLKGSNSDGIWSKEGLTIKVNVIPPFWATWWFRISLILAVMGLVFAGYRIRVRTAEARTRELEKLVQERTQEIQQRNQEMEALYRADEKMYRYLNIDQALQALVDVAVDILAADKCSVFLCEREKDKWGIKVSRGFKPSSIRSLVFEKDEGVIGRVLKTGKSIVVQDTWNDTRWKAEKPRIVKTVLAEEVRSLLFHPVKIGKEIFGIFTVCFTKPKAFNPDILRLFQALTQRAALSIENAMLFEQTKELAVLEERTRLAHDLHDSAKQKAFAAMAQLSTAKGIVDDDLPSAKGHLNEAEDLVYEVIQELTSLIQEMYPQGLKEKGLKISLEEYIFEWESRNNIQADFEVEHAMRLSMPIEQAFFRIAQEALANVARHSHATKVEIHLEYQPETVKMSIRDNGKGFDPAKRPSGIGLRAIRERTHSINGQVEIESTPGKGTTISVITKTGRQK
jgi:ligand-binding sensor domain-containing protein/signal transduction histidine kinase